ncbi:class I SAM-dependent methyltransferase [Cyanobacteria bacterium FACHB-63]|nr:class I SAM-dependent methyltransferase [Cyanobacteria bacterium FACHB-63]
MLSRAINRFQEFLLPLTSGISATNMEVILEGATNVPVQLSDWHRDYGAGSMWDLLAVCMIARHYNPKICFEIGTGHGRTTHHLALNTSDNTKICTLDISDTDVVGCVFRGQPSARKIRKLLGNSTSFDYSEWLGRVDLVIVDGDHSYEGVQEDTRRAFELLAPGGYILWDDFAPGWPGVVKALKEHDRARSFRRIAGTKWVYYADDRNAVSESLVVQPA